MQLISTLSPLGLIVLCITIFEIGILSCLAFYYLSRPSDKKRLWYLALMMLIIFNNISSVIFPIAGIGISLAIQDAIPFFLKIIISLYFAFYFYKAVDLKDFELLNNYGSFFSLVMPFIFLFLIPTLKESILFQNNEIANMIPFVHSCGFLYSTTIALRNRASSSSQGDRINLQFINCVYVAYLCWALLPLAILFGNFESHILLATNVSFLLMTIFYMKAAVANMKASYESLELSEQSLLKKVEERTEQIKEMYEERANIFINFAHEMRTPLTIIANRVDVMARNYGNIPGMKPLRFGVQRLSNDITDFFDSERYSKGFAVYDHNQVSDFSEILKNKIDIIKSTSDKKQLEIEDDVATALLVKAHPGAIDRIINNLLENAIKYSPKKEKIVISLSLEEGKICFSVSNSGAMIPLDQLEKVFEPYFQLATKNNDGIGIGLSIVKQIVEDIGGQIKIKSSDSKIWIAVTFPAYEGKEAVSTTLIDSPIQLPTDWIIKDIIGQAGKPNILLVEDDLELAHFLIQYLSDKYNVYAATSGEMGLSKVGVINNLSLIISDVMMKGMSGFEFCKAILTNERYEHIPFIFFTAKATDKDKFAGLNLGAIDYIEKPFLFDFLVLKIDSLLALLKKREEIVEASVKNSTGPHYPTGPIFDANCEKYGITHGEKNVLKLTITGKTDKEVAEILFRSEGTVGKHKSNIFRKTGVNSVPELILKVCFDQK